MKTHVSLEQIRVARPCPASWDAMEGDERMRFCGGCRKYVHNLSALPRQQAERLICEAAGRLCVRFERDERGNIVTLDYKPPVVSRYRLRPWLWLATIGAVIGSAGAYLLGMEPFVAPASPPAAGRVMGKFAVVGDMSMPVSLPNPGSANGSTPSGGPSPVSARSRAE